MKIKGSKKAMTRKKKQRAKTRGGRIHDSKWEKLRLASTRARKSGNAAHTCTGARIQGTGKPILPPMAESMRGPLKIVPSPKRQHHFTRTMPIPQREPHFHTPRTPHFRHMSRESAPGAGGLETGHRPAPCLSLAFSTPQAIKRIKPTTDPRRAPGGGGLPLPAAAAAAPGKYMKTKGSKTKRRKYEREERARKTKREQRGEREREKTDKHLHFQ